MSALPSLVFQNTTFTVIDRNGEPWLKASEIAQALGYAREDSVARIYDRNADEFTDQMSQTVNLTVSGQINGLQNVNVRIFSLRGAHLIAMFARTAVAKAFRVWVLDIIDHHLGRRTVEPAPVLERINSAQQHQLASMVARIEDNFHMRGSAAHAIWYRLRKNFGLQNTIGNLPALYYSQAVQVLAEFQKLCFAFKGLVIDFEMKFLRRVIRGGHALDIDAFEAEMHKEVTALFAQHRQTLSLIQTEINHVE